MASARSPIFGSMRVMVSSQESLSLGVTRLMLDPFAENIPEAGKLPKIIDEWLVQQVVDGKDTEAIMRSLQLSEEEKARVSQATVAFAR